MPSHDLLLVAVALPQRMAVPLTSSFPSSSPQISSNRRSCCSLICILLAPPTPDLRKSNGILDSRAMNIVCNRGSSNIPQRYCGLD
ncbi:hypothetical protein MRB53_041417 [Persea americana]|nr:hypothetical protein MRB53_041417 [Persea americana]